MWKDLMEILCCPVCKGELELTVKKEDETEVIDGNLYCKKCNENYPIEGGVADLRPAELRRKIG